MRVLIFAERLISMQGRVCERETLWLRWNRRWDLPQEHGQRSGRSNKITSTKESYIRLFSSRYTANDVFIYLECPMRKKIKLLNAEHMLC